MCVISFVYMCRILQGVVGSERALRNLYPCFFASGFQPAAGSLTMEE
jgi:hypothetical protein